MFKIFEISNKKRKEIFVKDGYFTVHELGLYELEYSNELLIHNVFFIEDEHIHEIKIKELSNYKITTHAFRFFEDFFGFAKISINHEKFNCNILGEKFDLKEIEEIILYLYERNHLVLNKFISKSSVGGSSVYEGKEYLYSSKYINLISNFCFSFEQLHNNFKNLPHTVVRKQIKLADYNTQTVDSKSIEWVLQNLDSVKFDLSNRYHPESIEISRNYGLIGKVAADEIQKSFTNYENEIILGAFEYLKKDILKYKQIIFLAIERNKIRSTFESSQYADFRDLKVIPFLRLLKELEAIEERLKIIDLRFKKIFLNVKPKNQYPKLTAVFYKYSHYQKAFSQIKLLRNSKYDLEGEIQLLNVKKLSTLYELYNLNILVDCLDGILGSKSFNKEMFFSEDSDAVNKIVYSSKTEALQIILFYQPIINNNSEDLNLITIGNVKLVDKHCSPDFVIEIKNNNTIRYSILDAKYSSIETVKNNYLTSCMKKYLMDIGIVGNPYQKSDFLILLHPDSLDNEDLYIYNRSYFPKILTIISKPKYSTRLKNVLLEFLSLI